MTKGYTTLQLARSLRHGIRWNYLETAIATGWATQGVFAVKLAKKEIVELKKIKKKFKPLSGIVMTLEQVTRVFPIASDFVLQYNGVGKPCEGTETYLLNNEKATHRINEYRVNAKYFDTIMDRYPNSKPYLSANFSAPIIFKTENEVVAVLMPLHNVE